MLKKELLLKWVKRTIIAVLLFLLVANFYENYKIQEFNNHIKENPFYSLDPVAGHVHSINYSKTIQWPEHQYGSFVMRTNNLGFREDHKTNRKKNEGELRILVTGDSHIDGVINNRESYPNILESLLGKQGTTIEIINGGVGFYSFKQYAGFLEKNKNLNPDLLIVTIYLGNDFIESIFYEEANLDFFATPASFYYRIKKQWIKATTGQESSQSINQVIYFSTFPSKKKKSIEIARSHIQKIKKSCEELNTEVVFVLLPSKLDIDSSMKNQVKASTGWPRKEIQICEELKNDLIPVFNQLDLPYIDLTSDFRASKNKLFWESDQHLNTLGHSLTATILYNKIDWGTLKLKLPSTNARNSEAEISK